MIRHVFVRCGAMLGLLFLSACAFTPAKLDLKPNVSYGQSDIGHGTTVSFKFVDERDDVTIGHRGAATMGAKISSEDLPHVIETKLKEGLTSKAFNVVPAGASSDAEITYRLVGFKFDIETGFFTGGRNASAALAVEARRKDRTYDNVYRSNSEERILFVPGESEINQQMNAALSQLLTKASADSELDHTLAGL